MNVLQSVILLLAAFAGSATARVPMETDITSFDRPTWKQTNRVTAMDIIEVTFVVKTCPMKRALLEEKFWAVSDPFGDAYKHYLSLEEVADLLHPLPDAEGRAKGEVPHFEAVLAWLASQEGLVAEKGLEGSDSVGVTKTRDLVRATLNAQKAEAVFGTELYHFVPLDDEAAEATLGESFSKGSMIRAAAPYSLPDALDGKVALVDKLLRLPHLRTAVVDKEEPKPASSLLKGKGAINDDGESDPFDSCTGAGVTCHGATTPLVLQQAYGFTPLANFSSGNSMACTEFQLQGIDADDLSNFASGCGVSHVEVDTVDGKGGEALPGVEALLDVEYIEAVASPIPLTVINSISYSLLDWATALNNDAAPAWVQSVSYGNDECEQVSDDYMYEANQQFVMNGARGLSVLFASGDQGVWGRSGHDASGVFHPDFPAGSPYVTAVGGTQFTVTGVVGSETAWADGGGGFSDTFPRPSYQAAAVLGYLASGVELPPASAYNQTGRAYPDVSALAGTANGYCVAAKGQFLKVGGTSAACPVFAGMVALLNDALLHSGQPAMGFLNPWIYGVAGPSGVFNDVTTGTNNAGVGSGFTATAGWDPATGFGTPNYPAMSKSVMG